jgi:hypothetical protein
VRFEYERVTSRSILRRVAENEALTGKRVETVWLTHQEWREFVNNEGRHLYQQLDPKLAAWRLTRPPKMPTFYSLDSYVQSYDETIITVRPEL